MHETDAIIDNIRTLRSASYLLKTKSLFEIDEVVVKELILISKWLRGCWNMAKAGKPITTVIYEAFWKTIPCILTENGHLTPRAYSRYLCKYLESMRQSVWPSCRITASLKSSSTVTIRGISTYVRLV